MPEIWIDEEVFAAIKDQAEPFVDNDPNDVLRRILLAEDGVADDERRSGTIRLVPPNKQRKRRAQGSRGGEVALADHLREVEPHVEKLFNELNDRLLARDDELRHHLTQTYIGYRRGSDFKASVTLRTSYLKVLLPLDPSEHVDRPQVRDITGKGRHGRTDHNLEYSIRGQQDIDTFMELFGDFFGASPDDNDVGK